MSHAHQKNWWERNWKWVVPTGIVSFIAIVAAFAAVIVTVVFGTMKKSAVVKESVAMARQNPDLQRELGSPIETGWYLSGSISVSGGSGEADLMVPISGPHNKAKLYIVAEKSAGQWEFDLVEAEIAGSKARIDVLSAADR